MHPLLNVLNADLSALFSHLSVLVACHSLANGNNHLQVGASFGDSDGNSFLGIQAFLVCDYTFASCIWKLGEGILSFFLKIQNGCSRYY
jgi:hypothetical protein